MFIHVQRATRRKGATFLEIVMATLITGLMLVVSLNGVGSVFQTNEQNADRLLGPGLAHELICEIMSMPYKDPDANTTTLGTDTGESGVTRANYDDVDDYNGLNSLGIRSKSGTILTAYSGWRQQSTVQWIEVLTGAVWILGDTGLKRITVTITSPEGEITQLRAFRYKEGMLEQPPVLDTTAVTWMGAELQLGSGTSPARMGANLPNHTPDVN